MATRNFGYTFGRTPEGAEADYNNLMKRLAEEGKTPEQVKPEEQGGGQPENRTPAKSLDGFAYSPTLGLYVRKEKLFMGDSYKYNWNRTHEELNRMNSNGKRLFMPTPFEFMSYINDLQEGKVQGLKQGEREKILDDILKTGDWRATWLDAYFKDGKIWTRNKTKPEKLDCPINEDCYVLLNKFNQQGMPTTKSKTQSYEPRKNVRFWYPREGAVARFIAGSDGTNFICVRDPTSANSSLGVFPFREL